MESKPQSLKVCVVGAGLSGLAAIKELVEEGHRVVCYERTGREGGVFHYPQDRSGAYDQLLLTVSNYFMAYSAMRPSEETRRYWTIDEYSRYLHRYVEKFHLLEHIVFHADVTGLRQAPDEAWQVTVQMGDQAVEETFDAVVFCTGKFFTPHVPAFPGIDTFRGQVVHSLDYRNADAFAGRRVVCIGMGESGSDICHEIAAVADSATLVMRTPPYVVPRSIPMGNGDVGTNDVFTTPFIYSLYAFNYHRSPVVRHLYRTLNKKFRSSQTDPALNLVYEWADMSGWVAGQFFTKNDIFLPDILSGRLRFNLFGIDRIEDDRVVCGDGTEVPADVLVLCTGFRDDFSLFRDVPPMQEAQNNSRRLYKHMIHPQVGSRLAILGFARPAAGGVPLCSELQARYLARIYSGKIDLPGPELLERERERDEQAESEHYFLQPHIKELIVYHTYVEDLARKIGCFPGWATFVSNPSLLWKYYFGSTVPAFFRLRGPGRMTRECTSIIKQLPIGQSVPEIAKLLVYKAFLNGTALVDCISGGRLSKRLADNPETLDAYLARQLNQSVDTEQTLFSYCRDDVQWQNMKYRIVNQFDLEPMSIHLDSRVSDLVALERAASTDPNGR